MRPNNEYRQEAKDLMTGKYGPVIVTTLITGFIAGIPNRLATEYGPSYDFDFETRRWILQEASNQALSSLFQIVAFVLSALFVYGIAKLYIEIANNRNYNIESVLKTSFTDQPVRSILYSFISSLFVSLWTLLFIIPGIMAVYKYAMGPFLLNVEPDLSALDAVGKSKQHMMGHRWQLFLLDLSYLGWYILGIFTLGILWLWIVPKHRTARTLFFKERYFEVHPVQTPEPTADLPDFVQS
jgi:uncharacterized membrane protein